MKLKDYEIPQYGSGDGLGEDLSQYNLKNFDLKAFQAAESPTPAAAWTPPAAEAWTPPPPAWTPPPPAWTAPPEPPQEQSVSLTPPPIPAEVPVQAELFPGPPAFDPSDVQFGAHFGLQTFSVTPMTPTQQWKLPRWVLTSVGLFFGAAAVLMLVSCIVLLRDPKPAVQEPVAAPTVAVATPSAAAPQPASSPVVSKPIATPKVSVAEPAAVRHAAPATVAVAHRVAVSRHPTFVRRQTYRSRRVASRSESSTVATQETQTVSHREPDALDKLLGESSL